MEKRWDYIVVGGGLAGVLAACKQKQLKPSAQVLLIEKESQLGGRLQSLDIEGNHYRGKVFNNISPSLARFCAEFCGLEWEEKTSQAQLQIYVDHKLHSFSLDSGVPEQLFKSLGLRQGSKKWHKIFAELMESSDLHKRVDKIIKIDHKDPSYRMVKQFVAAWLGFPDFSLVQGRALVERLQSHQQEAYWGVFEQQLSKHCSDLGVEVKLDSQLLSSVHKEGVWQLRSRTGYLEADQLAVAMPIYEAIKWLDQDCISDEVLNYAIKGRCVSAVSLVADCETESDLPVAFYSPRDETLIHSGKGYVALQQALPYESSLQAPKVLKTIKSLKRCLVKLTKDFELKVLHEHVALIPIAWPNGGELEEQKLSSKLVANKLKSEQLSFIGDCYGATQDLEANLITSLQNLFPES